MGTAKRYSSEVRERAVHLVFEREGEHGCSISQSRVVRDGLTELRVFRPCRAPVPFPARPAFRSMPAGRTRYRNVPPPGRAGYTCANDAAIARTSRIGHKCIVAFAATRTLVRRGRIRGRLPGLGSRSRARPRSYRRARASPIHEGPSATRRVQGTLVRQPLQACRADVPLHLGIARTGVCDSESAPLPPRHPPQQEQQGLSPRQPGLGDARRAAHARRPQSELPLLRRHLPRQSRRHTALGRRYPLEPSPPGSRLFRDPRRGRVRIRPRGETSASEQAVE